LTRENAEQRYGLDRSWRKVAVAKQVNLVLANIFWAQAIWRTVEVVCEILYGVDKARTVFWA
jgi:hypothetical protein